MAYGTQEKTGAHDKLELKEMVDRPRFLSLLQSWQEAMNQDADLTVTVKGQTYTIPADAFAKGRYRVEYEIKHGEHEFELTLKWK